MSFIDRTLYKSTYGDLTGMQLKKLAPQVFFSESQKMPTEIFLKILSYLSLKDRWVLSLVNSICYLQGSLAEQNQLVIRIKNLGNLLYRCSGAEERAKCEQSIVKILQLPANRCFRFYHHCLQEIEPNLKKVLELDCSPQAIGTVLSMLKLPRFRMYIETIFQYLWELLSKGKVKYLNTDSEKKLIDFHTAIDKEIEAIHLLDDAEDRDIQAVFLGLLLIKQHKQLKPQGAHLLNKALGLIKYMGDTIFAVKNYAREIILAWQGEKELDVPLFIACLKQIPKDRLTLLEKLGKKLKARWQFKEASLVREALKQVVRDSIGINCPVTIKSF